MSEQATKPQPGEYLDVVDLPNGGFIVITPVSYKLARETKAQVAKMATAAAGGAEAMTRAGLDDQLLDLMEKCCSPKPSDIEDLPLSIGAEIMVRWLKLNTRPDRWSFTVGLLEEMISQLTGQPISLKTIWSSFASPAVSSVVTSIAAAGHGLTTQDGLSPSSTTEQVPPSDSSTDSGQTASAI